MLKKLVLSLLLIFSLNMILGNTIDLSDIRRIALKNNIELKASKEEKMASKWDYYNSRLSLFPSAQIEGSFMKYHPDLPGSLTSTYDNKTTYQLSINQPIFNGGKIWLTSEIKKNTFKISQKNYSAKELEIITQAEIYYLNLLESKKLKEISEKSLESAQMNLEIAQVKFETGVISNADLLNVKSQKANKEVALLQAENIYKINKLTLQNYLNYQQEFTLTDIPKDNYINLINKLSALSTSKINEVTKTLTKTAVNNNPILEISDLSVKTNKTALLMAKGNFLPSVNLNYSKNWSQYDMENDFTDQEQIMLTASVPIFPIFDNYSGHKKAKYDLIKSKYDKRNNYDSIKLGVRSLALNLVAAAKSVKAAETALEYSQETYNQMEERYKNDLISTSELLDAEIMLDSAKNQYTNAIYDFLENKSKLKQQIGLINDQEINTLIINIK